MEDQGSTNNKAGKTAHQDLRQAVTDRIIAMLEKGGNVFRARWTTAASRGLPRNGQTGQPYHGVNVLLLWDAAMEHGYPSNVWLTYRQAASLGAQVRQGEHGVQCVYFEQRVGKGGGGRAVAPADARDDDSTEVTGSPRSVLLCKAFWLFNVAQIDGLPAALVSEAAAPAVSSEQAPIVAAMRLVAACGARVRHGFPRAAYAPSSDQILMPELSVFTGPEAYCATMLHELVHWTGHATRLDRRFGQRFGDVAYAFEELVAELGSAYLLGHAGLVDATIEGHAAYLDSWLQILRHDRTAILTAARLAGQAYDFILAREAPQASESGAAAAGLAALPGTA